MRQGLSLLEVIIALAVFSVLVVAVTQSVVSTRRFAEMQDIEHVVEFKGARALDRITADLCNSAWGPNRVAVPTNASIFPRVGAGATAFGDSLSFFKLRTQDAIVANPAQVGVDRVNFDDFTAVNVPVALSAFTQGRPIGALVLNSAWNPASPNDPPFVALVWESFQSLQSTTAGANFTANQDPANLRQFRYTVIPDLRTGLGVLVRQFRNGGTADDSGWPAAVVPDNAVAIVDDVVEVRFATYLTEADASAALLNANQIRMTLILAQASRETDAVDAGGAGVLIRRRFAATVALRSVTNAEPE